MKKILMVFGTRPEAIKMAPLVRKLLSSGAFNVEVCVTGQHKEMLNQVLELFNIIPNYDLEVMAPGQTLSSLTARVLTAMPAVLEESKPEMVLVHGDTTTAMAAALSAYYYQTPVGHVEAGLRTNDIYSPWPEEMNRRLIGRIASVHYAPTDLSKSRLLDEGVSAESIMVTGNTVIDALLEVVDVIDKDRLVKSKLEQEFAFLDSGKKLILVTGHRRENFGQGFENICKAILDISAREDVQVVYPVHLNPKVQEPVSRILGSRRNVFLIEPLSYISFCYLMMKSYLVLTDSGGIQEEAPSLGKPVLVMRDNTERPEAVSAGTVKLVGADSEKITNAVISLLENHDLYSQMARAHNPYGTGDASEVISNHLKGYL